MIKNGYRILLAMLLLTNLSFAQTVNPFYEDGNIYIKIKPPFADISKKKQSINIDELPFLKTINALYNITHIKLPFAFAKNDGLDNILKINISAINKIDEAVGALSKLEQVAYAEKVPYKKFYNFVPNDTDYNNVEQWNLFKINAQIAWNYFGGSTPANPAIIAIIDDGVDVNHIDLKANIWVNTLEQNGDPLIDDDNNGFLNDSLGYDFGSFDNDPNPDQLTWYHGTHVAGIASAITNNLTGIASIGLNAKIMAIKATYDNLFISNGYDAIVYASDNGANIINLSWGTPAYSATEQGVITYAHSAGAVIISAAGNDGSSTINYPAGYTHVISVGSTGNNDVRSSGSSYGQWIDVSAPGTSIYSTVPGNLFAILSGTSMSCPLVAGLAALMKTYNPQLTTQQIEDCIKNNTDNIDFMNPNYIGQLGAGRINAFKAMQCVNATLNQLDAGLVNISSPTNNVCGNPIIPILTIKNYGINNLLSLKINYQLDNGLPSLINWNGSLEQDSTQTILLPAINTFSGNHTLKIYSSNPNNGLDVNYSNDTLTANFQYLGSGISLPFFENFENGLSNQNWSIINPDNLNNWQVKQGLLDSISNKAAFINLYNDDHIGERDGLLTPPLNLIGYDSLKLEFNYAYQYNDSVPSDSLIILASTDCGATFTHRLAAYAHDSINPFATYTNANNSYFNPALSSQWCGNLTNCISIDLTSLAGNSSVILQFQSYNQFNNNLYIDNISITGIDLALNAPSANITVSSDTICVGDIVTFNAVSNGNVNQWNWTFSGGIPATATTQSVAVLYANAGNIIATCVIHNANGDSTITLNNPISINDTPIINIVQNDTTICADNGIVLTATGGLTYVWAPTTGLNINTGQTVIALPHMPISYTVTGINFAGCKSSDIITIDTTVCLSINTIAAKEFSLFYNQNDNFLVLKNLGQNATTVTVEIYTVQGQKVISFNNISLQKNGAENIPFKQFANGLYVYQILLNNELKSTNKFIKINN